MNKLGIWGIAIAGAFVVGILSANPVVEGVGGWKEAIESITSESPLTFVRCDIHGTQICWTTTNSVTQSVAQSTSFWTVIPTSGTLTNLIAKVSSGPPIGAGESITITLLINDVDTSVTCVLAESDTTCSDTTNSVPVSFGDRIQLRMTANTAGTDIVILSSILLNS